MIGIPLIAFLEREIEKDINATVNDKGTAYIGRKYKGRRVRCIILKDVVKNG